MKQNTKQTPNEMFSLYSLFYDLTGTFFSPSEDEPEEVVFARRRYIAFVENVVEYATTAFGGAIGTNDRIVANSGSTDVADAFQLSGGFQFKYNADNNHQFNRPVRDLLVATLPLVDVSAPSSLTTGNEQLVGVSYDYIKTICEAISGGLDSEIAKGTEYVLEQNGKIVAEIVSLQKTFGRFIPTEEHHHVTPTLTWYATAPRDGKGSFDSRGFSVAFSADPFSLRRVASRNIEIAEYSGRITFPIDVHPNDVLKSMYIAKQQIVEYSRQQIQREEGK